MSTKYDHEQTSTLERPLNAYECWMVKTHLEAIERKQTDALERIGILRNNGYLRVASEVAILCKRMRLIP